MIAALKSAVLAAGFVLAGSADYQPQILTLAWPDGHVERLAATSPDTCAMALRAIVTGLWRPAEIEPQTATCSPGDLFAAGSTCIAGFNCGGRR